jgi:hypothetical protein
LASTALKFFVRITISAAFATPTFPVVPKWKQPAKAQWYLFAGNFLSQSVANRKSA